MRLGTTAKTPAPVRRLYNGSVHRLRLATSAQRMLPSFLIIGAMKGGTTSLFHYLTLHPCVLQPFRKEIEYFTLYHRLGEGWYRSHFPTVQYHRLLERRLGRTPVTGEATVYYLFHPAVPARAARLLPHARLIVMLRNPIDRAYSQYQGRLRLGQETLPFEAATEAEEERLGGEHERLLRSDTETSWVHAHHSYLARGRYAEQLERWFAHFPREQFLIMSSEAFYRDPERGYQQALEFLGLEPQPLPTREARNSGGGYDKLRPETRQRLARYFRPYNERLYALLDTNFGWDDADQ